MSTLPHFSRSAPSAEPVALSSEAASPPIITPLEHMLKFCMRTTSDGAYRVYGEIDRLYSQPDFVFARFKHHSDHVVVDGGGRRYCGQKAYLVLEEPNAIQNRDARLRMAHVTSALKQAYDKSTGVSVTVAPLRDEFTAENVPPLPMFRIITID